MSRYKAYPEYVPSVVEFLDSLPFGWRTLRGKYVFSEYSERSELGEEQLLSVSEYYGVKPRGEVIEEGEFLSRAESLIGYKKCQKNDLVMNIMLAWKCGLGVSKYDGIVSPAYSVFRFNGNASPDYMHYLLRTDTYTGHFKTRSTGVIDSRLRLYPESFSDVSLVLPSINEQEKIVAFLDHETAKIDALIEKQQRLIELLKEKRQAVISHAVTKGLNPNAPMKDSGVEWLGEVPAHWGVCRLKHAIKSGSSISYGIVQPGEPLDEGVPFVQTTNMSRGSFGIDDLQKTTKEIAAAYPRSTLEGGEVILGIRASIGAAYVVPESLKGVNLSRGVARITPGMSLLSSYLVLFFGTDAVSRYWELSKQGSTFSEVSIETVREMGLLIPPKSEQVEIEESIKQRLFKMDVVLNLAVNKVSLLQERRTALISAAVTGKIDVRDWQAAA